MELRVLKYSAVSRMEFGADKGPGGDAQRTNWNNARSAAFLQHEVTMYIATLSRRGTPRAIEHFIALQFDVLSSAMLRIL
jgi:hypothetical protein